MTTYTSTHPKKIANNLGWSSGGITSPARIHLVEFVLKICPYKSSDGDFTVSSDEKYHIVVN